MHLKIFDMNGDLSLAKLYYRLYEQRIYYHHVLDIYKHYGTLAPVIEKFSAACSSLIHDVGNGLNTIQACLEHLALMDLEFEQTRIIAQAQALCQCSGWRLYTLAEVSPAPPSIPAPIDLPIWLEQQLATLDIYRPSNTVVKFDTTQPHLIVPDYGYRLRLALMELLFNAFNSVVNVNNGQVCILMQQHEKGIAQIEIIDNGYGLPTQNPEECFDLRFTTGPHVYGLGLIVVRRIVEKNRGTFLLETMNNGRTHAIIQIPTGNPHPDWESEKALVLALEALHDEVTAQEQEVEKVRLAFAKPRESYLTLLSTLLGQLSASVTNFIARNLDHIRQEITTITDQFSDATRHNIPLLLDKCEYCRLMLGNARALDPNLTVCPTIVNLNTVIERAIQLIAWRAQIGTEIHFTQSPNLPLVQTDQDLTMIVLLNLLRNALDVTGQNGSVEVLTSQTKHEVTVRIINTGTTIVPEMQARVFDLDYTTRAEREFGLGLHVAKKIMVDNIKVHTTPDGRVEFKLRFQSTKTDHLFSP
ncbi:MAG: hypothetical protein JXA21_17760 [Anaerolineae bacterium]|nr:hypothetical protein [Anaerolineae bacterium]